VVIEDADGVELEGTPLVQEATTSAMSSRLRRFEAGLGERLVRGCGEPMTARERI
jgi:hypothetical protein